MALLMSIEDPTWSRDVPLITEDNLFLAPQRNEADETRKNLIFKELGASRVVGETKHVEYGTYHGETACLILLRFFFRGPRRSFRWTFGEVIVKFTKQKSAAVSPPPPAGSPGSKAASSVPDPAVVMYGPRRILGAATQENRHWTYEAKLKATATVGFAEAGPEGKIGLETQFDRDHRMAIIGSPSQPTRSGGYKEVGWTLEENDSQKSAIPDEIIVGMIVKSQDPFQAAVKVKVSNNLSVSLFGWPWSKVDDPLLFDLKDPGFKKITTGVFENLTDDEWGILLGLRGEWENQVMSR